MSAATWAVVRRVTGRRPATTSAPAREAQPASTAPAHPGLTSAMLAMYAVVGAVPPALWSATWTTPPALRSRDDAA